MELGFVFKSGAKNFEKIRNLFSTYPIMPDIILLVSLEVPRACAGEQAKSGDRLPEISSKYFMTMGVLVTQRESNPYPYSDSNKRYMTYDWYMKRRFGGKAARIALDIGCTCPNIDGTRGTGGCIFCKNGSSSAMGESLDEQFEHGKDIARRKWKVAGFVPYFQAHTNTWGDPALLSAAYNHAAVWKDVLMIALATRPDSISEELTGSLVRLARKVPLIVEFGLQTSNDKTAARINRCHTWAEFCAGYEKLRAAADKVNAECRDELPADGREIPGLRMKRFQIGVHLIDGLPGEDAEDMLRTARDTAALRPDMVKIHLLHVLEGTRLAKLYESGDYEPMSREDYVRVVADQLELLPPDAVIGRVTGDAAENELLAPDWCVKKTIVANEIDKELYRRNSWQGRRFCI